VRLAGRAAELGQRMGWRQVAAMARAAQHGLGPKSWNAFQRVSTGVFRGVGSAGQATQAARQAYWRYLAIRNAVAHPMRLAGQAGQYAGQFGRVASLHMLSRPWVARTTMFGLGFAQSYSPSGIPIVLPFAPAYQAAGVYAGIGFQNRDQIQRAIMGW